MKRLLSLVVLLALLVVPATSAFAQDGTNPLCEGLTADDCALLVASDEAMLGATSFVMANWSASFNLDMPNEEGVVETVAMAVSGPTGGINLAPDADVVLDLVIDSLTVSAPDEDDVAISNVEVIITQEMAYIMFEGEWYGGTLEEAEIDLSGMSDVSSMVSSDALSMLGIDLTGVMTSTRSDADLNGQSMAVISTDINVGQLIVAVLASPMVGSLLSEEMGGEAMTAEDLQMVGMFLTPMLTGTTLTTERWISLADSMVYKSSLDLVLVLDLSMMELGQFNGELHASAEMSNYGEALSAAIPAAYAPLADLDAAGELDLGNLSEGLSGLGM